jgi:hypothetical protein
MTFWLVEAVIAKFEYGTWLVAVGIIDVDLRIIQRNDYVLRSEMKTCHHTLVRSDVALSAATTFIPC